MIDWPVDEFMYFLEGQVEITNEDGSSRIYGPGDAIVMPKGFNGIWRQKIAMLALVAQQDKRWIDPPESGQSLPDYCLPLIRKHYPDLTADAIDDVVVRGGDGLVIINAGLPSAMAEFIRVQEEERHGLYYVGEYLSHAHTGGACASGRSIARLIMKHWA